MTTPHDRQLVDYIIKTWKSDPATEKLGIKDLSILVQKSQPEWIVEEDRVRSLLKMFGLTPPVDEELYTFVDNIKSEITPGLKLTDSIDIRMTTNKGKSVYLKKNIIKGELLWQETPLFVIPSKDEITYMKSKIMCSYCTKVTLSKKNINCKNCIQIWCSKKCEKSDKVHRLIHNGSPAFDSKAYAILDDFCSQEEWSGLRAIAIIQANLILDGSDDLRSRQFKAMAGIAQEERQKATVNGLFAEEQAENLLHNGYTLFGNVFKQANVTYEEFLYMLGTYNLNNLSNKVFLTYSHLNHDCTPNVSHEVKDGIVKVTANRDIEEGEELSTTYVNPAHVVGDRQYELRINWGFVCGCVRCTKEKQ